MFMLSRIKNLWIKLRPKVVNLLKITAEILKLLLIGSVIFIGMPFIHEISDVHGRLDVNIYDFYSVAILIYLAYRMYILELMVAKLKKADRVYFSVEEDNIDDDEWFKVD